MSIASRTPIALFAYARPGHLSRTLECLRAEHVPLIYAFSDGPRTPDKEPAVAQVRDMLHAIYWCEVILTERQENWGLGRSILAGVTDVLSKHDRIIVSEDDLIFVPGTFDYLCAALDHYQDDPSVMSVTGWTHAKVTPPDVTNQPYFDGRAECLIWGTWAHVWQGMDHDAKTIMRECVAKGIDTYRYGADLPAMAEIELQQNIWAVRFLYHHILRGGLCLRPPHSLVEHIGFDAMATNSPDGSLWAAPPLKPCPPVPSVWPTPIENEACPRLWQQVYGYRLSTLRQGARFGRRVVARARRILRGNGRR